MTSKPYILSVEDNVTDVTLMKRVFEKSIPKYDAVFFPDTDVAMDFLEVKYKNSDLPKLILLDIKLVKGNGLDLLRDIKNDKRFKNIPVVMLSSSDREDDKKEAANRNCNAYIEKPRSYKDLNTELPKIINFWSQKND